MSAASIRTARRAACLIVFLCSGFASAGWAQQQPRPLPPAATPGGVQPRQAPPAPSEASLAPFVVPRVPSRPLGIEEGPRVRVVRFELLGGATHPGVPAGEVNDVLKTAITDQPPEGYTVNQLQTVADKVAERYRAHGYILTQAIIPAQDVVGGIVNVLVLEGSLAEVKFEGQRMYSPETLRKPFEPLLSRAVRKEEIESALLYLTDYPGLTAFGVFQAGDRVGTTDLVVRTQHEERYSLDTTVDNQGSQFSGEYRANLGLTLNDMFGQADKLNLYALYAFDPEDADSKGLYGGIDYHLPIYGPANEVQLGFSHNLFEVGQVLRELGIKGVTDIGQVGVNHFLWKTRLSDASVNVGLARKDAQFEQQESLTAHDVLTVGTLGYQWSSIGLTSRGITQVSLLYSHGFSDLFGAMSDYSEQTGVRSSRLDAGGDFDKIGGQVQRFQRITQQSALLLRVSGQYTSDILVSLEQFSIGGPDTVRAYPTAEFLADSAVFASAEFIVNAPGFAGRPAFGGYNWGQLLQVSLFFDYATGKLNEVLPGEDETADLSGWGGAIQLNVPNRFFIRLDLATPNSKAEPTNGRDPQYFFRVGFTL